MELSHCLPSRAAAFVAHRRRTVARAMFFYFTLLLWESLVFAACGLAVRWPLPLYVCLFSLAPALLATALCGCFGARGGIAMHLLLTTLCTILYGSQIIYHTVFGTFYTSYSMLNGGKALGFFDIILGAMSKQLPALAMLLVPLALLLCTLLPKMRGIWCAEQTRLRGGIRACLVALAAQCLGVTLLFFTGLTPQGAFDTYFCTNALAPASQRLGLYTAARLDLQRYLFGFTPVGEHLLFMSDATIDAYDGSLAPEDAENTDSAFQGEPQILELDWDAMNAAETNPVLREMNTHFSTHTPTETNEMTGVFEGKNLIFITAEAFSPLAVDAQRTPTLYKMMHEGFQFENFYTPIWGVSTLDGEYTNFLSLLPKEGVWSMLESADNALPFTLGNQFKALGYETKAYHNHTFDYYSRQLSHPNLGYSYKGYGNGLDVTWQWPESDVEMINLTAADFSTGKPFHIYYLTISGHLAYNFDGGNAMASKHEAAVADLPYSAPVRAYLAGQIELDKAMETLLDALETAGQLENTVIALAPDHYPYGLTTAEIGELTGHAVETEFELYESAFLLYNAGMPDAGKIIKRPCSNLDILPTLSNLFGLPYDSRLMMGTDIFSTTDPLVIFATRSWITNLASYNATTNTLTPHVAAALPPHYAQDVSRRVANIFSDSQKILDNNYYAKIKPLSP